MKQLTYLEGTVQPTFSRRQLLVAGATIASSSLFLASPVLGGQSSDSDVPSLATDDRKISIMPPSHPNFASVVDQLYPGLGADPKFQMLAPLAAVVTHHGGPAVRACTVCWSITTGNGTYEAALFRVAPPWSKRKGRKGRTIASAQTNILRSGESRLVTPFMMLSPNSYRTSPTAWQAAMQPKEPATFLASETAQATQINVWLDAVIYGDRKCLGQDKHHLARRLRSRRNAEHDVARAILALLSSGRSDQDVRTAILAQATKDRSKQQGSKGWYEQAKKHHAQILLKKFDNLGREKFTKIVVRTAKLRKTIIHKVGT